jgi:hypothetical protein
MQYISALILHVQRRMEISKGGVISIKTRHVCERDRRCARTVNKLMMSLVKIGLARRHKQGVYLIEKYAVEQVLTFLKRQCGGCPSHKKSSTGKRPRRVQKAAE